MIIFDKSELDQVRRVDKFALFPKTMSDGNVILWEWYTQSEKLIKVDMGMRKIWMVDTDSIMRRKGNPIIEPISEGVLIKLDCREASGEGNHRTLVGHKLGNKMYKHQIKPHFSGDNLSIKIPHQVKKVSISFIEGLTDDIIHSVNSIKIIGDKDVVDKFKAVIGNKVTS